MLDSIRMSPSAKMQSFGRGNHSHLVWIDLTSIAKGSLSWSSGCILSFVACCLFYTWIQNNWSLYAWPKQDVPGSKLMYLHAQKWPVDYTWHIIFHDTASFVQTPPSWSNTFSGAAAGLSAHRPLWFSSWPLAWTSLSKLHSIQVNLYWDMVSSWIIISSNSPACSFVLSLS